MSYKPQLPPKRLFIYSLRKGFFSVNEYVNSKQRNVIKPFKANDDEALKKLSEMLDLFRRTTKRDIVVVANTQEAKDLAKRLSLKIE